MEIIEITEITKEELAKNWSYRVLPNQTIRLNKYIAEGEVPRLVIPSLAGGKKITEIGERAFAQNYHEHNTIQRAKSETWKIKQIVFPVYLVHVGMAAFAGCSELESIVFHEGLREIMKDAFVDCPNIKSATLPKSLKHIGEHCFDNKPTILIYAPKGSYAEKYAKDHQNLEFEQSTLKVDQIDQIDMEDEAQSKKLSAKSRVWLLERAVLDGTVEELAQVIEKYAPFEFTARALGFAMRYGGEEKVRLLKSAGASFEYDKEDRKFKSKYHTSARNERYWNNVLYELFPIFDKLFDYPQFCGAIYGRYEQLEILAPDYYVYIPHSNYRWSASEKIHYGEERKILPEEERAAAILAYYENTSRSETKSAALFFALSLGQYKIADTLIKSGFDLGKTFFGGIHADIYFFLEAHKKEHDMRLFEQMLRRAGTRRIMSDQTFSRHLALGEYWNIEHMELLCTLVCYTNLAISKKLSVEAKEKSEDDDTLLISRNRANEFLSFAIESDSDSAAVKICESGLINEKNINKYIELSSSQKKTQVLAVFMEWKNKNVDLAHEQRKSEERLKRRMNKKIDPNSFGEMKKTWDMSYSQREITITGYKGSDTKITIPVKIGARDVTSIGSRAFFKNSSLEKVVLQEGIQTIESGAFESCTGLIDIVLPKSLKSIGWEAFKGCAGLEKITIPDKVNYIYRDAFYNCPKLKICARRGSEAENHAKKYKIPFIDSKFESIFTGEDAK